MNAWIASLLVALAPAVSAQAADCPGQTVSNCSGYVKRGPNYDTCVEYLTILVIRIPTGKTTCWTSYLVAPPHRHCDPAHGSNMRCVPAPAIAIQLFVCACVQPDPSSPSESCRCDPPTNAGTLQDWDIEECPPEG